MAMASNTPCSAVMTKNQESRPHQLVVGEARAFAETVWLVESEIQRLGADPEHSRPIGGESKGWPSQAVWESLKARAID